MCGIAGVFGRSDPATVDRMLGRLAHRGPDDQFLVSGRRFTLGARRLAILDPEGGRQPLSDESGSVWAVQNGELYTFPELRAELEAKGHRFHTRTDTELIPHLYEDWGSRFPARLSGMFAIGVWDDERGIGVLARDHVGKKPLYFFELDGAVWFASEIKALLAVPGCPRTLDPVAIHHFLSYKHVPAPATGFTGIESLNPGELLVWSPGGSPRRERYATLSWQTDPAWKRMDEEEIAARLADTLRESVRRRLLSDVPVGFYLSGGLDSSLTTALAATLASGAIETFTLTYDNASGTEGKAADRQWARAVAERYGTEHHEERISVGSFAEEFREIVHCFDQPFSGVVSTYFLARLIGRHVKVALSGDGADELFGSYLTHRLAPAIAAYLTEGPQALERPWWAESRTLVPAIADPDPARWRARLHVFGESEKRALYTPSFAEQIREASSDEHECSYFDRATATDPLNRILEAEFRSQLPDQVLAFVDRLSMAHSLETRCPFLDREVVALAASLPGSLKISDGTTKAILKRAAAPYLPAELIHRQKEGFVMPVNQWLANELDAFTAEVIAPARVREAGIVRPDATAGLIERFRRGERALANRVLSLISLHIWWEDYFGGARVY